MCHACRAIWEALQRSFKEARMKAARGNGSGASPGLFPQIQTHAFPANFAGRCVNDF